MTKVWSAEDRLVDHALSVDLDRLPARLRRHICHLVFDTLAVGIGGALQRHPSGTITEAYVLDRCGSLDERRGATLWSGRGRVPAEEAALVNGTFAEILDYQDTVIHPRNAGHLAVTVVPAALAVAEEVGASPRRLVEAVTAGIDVGVAILAAVGKNHRMGGRGFRTTALSGPPGAAIAAALLFGLDHRQTAMALGLAVASAPKGLMASLAADGGEFAMDKDLQNGLCAQLGVAAARLAGRGMTASARSVTGVNGLLASQAEGDDRPLEPPEPGDSFARYLCLKPAPACYGVLASVEAALALRAALPSPGPVERVVVRIKDVSATSLNIYDPANATAARFSLPYCVASALVRGRLAPPDFEAAALEDAEVRALMDRVEITADEGLSRAYHEEGAFGGEVEVVVRGRTLCRRVMAPAGSYQRPLSEEQVIGKFKELASADWSAARIEAFSQSADLLACEALSVISRPIEQARAA